MRRDEIIKALRLFKEGNQQRYRIEKIGIFGSSARGDMNYESDIDVVVVLEKQDLFSLIGIKQDLEEKFGLPVDVVSYREKMNSYLRRRIEDEALLPNCQQVDGSLAGHGGQGTLGRTAVQSRTNPNFQRRLET